MRKGLCVAGLALATLGAGAGVSQKWLEKVPAADRARVNPYNGQADEIVAGQLLFEDHCAACHGKDRMGRYGKPSLRTPIVQNATDGELFWLLKNGDPRHGMPSWSSLPEPERWQIVAYVKSGGQIAK
jgi:mono/diheme cytochrome c family protein